jgi:hypothetical protein
MFQTTNQFKLWAVQTRKTRSLGTSSSNCFQIPENGYLRKTMNKIYSGWWLTYPSEKYESQWEGLSHILWQIKNV